MENSADPQQRLALYSELVSFLYDPCREYFYDESILGSGKLVCMLISINK